MRALAELAACRWASGHVGQTSPAMNLLDDNRSLNFELTAAELPAPIDQQVNSYPTLAGSCSNPDQANPCCTLPFLATALNAMAAAASATSTRTRYTASDYAFVCWSVRDKILREGQHMSCRASSCISQGSLHRFARAGSAFPDRLGASGQFGQSRTHVLEKSPREKLLNNHRHRSNRKHHNQQGYQARTSSRQARRNNGRSQKPPACRRSRTALKLNEPQLWQA